MSDDKKQTNEMMPALIDTKTGEVIEKPEQETPREARDSAVATIIKDAYQSASKVKVSKDEAKALCADFGDDDFEYGAAGKENLIYIKHPSLRKRFNTALGLGQTAVIPLRSWSETFEGHNSRGTYTAVRVYVDAVLLIRGAFAAQAIGDMTYYLSNDSQNFGDAYEGAKTQAFRRCAKEFGVGLQAWDKGFVEEWKRNHPLQSNGRPSTARPQPPESQTQTTTSGRSSTRSRSSRTAGKPAPAAQSKPTQPTGGDHKALANGTFVSAYYVWCKDNSAKEADRILQAVGFNQPADVHDEDTQKKILQALEDRANALFNGAFVAWAEKYGDDEAYKILGANGVETPQQVTVPADRKKIAAAFKNRAQELDRINEEFKRKVVHEASAPVQGVLD